jgi:hypothetical protein
MEGKGLKGLAKRVLKNTSLGESVRAFTRRNTHVAADVILLRLLITDAALRFVSAASD